MHDDLDNPLILCGWAALRDGLRIVNERDPQFQMVKKTAPAIEDYIPRARDRLLEFNFPSWKQGDKTARAADYNPPVPRRTVVKIRPPQPVMQVREVAPAPKQRAEKKVREVSVKATSERDRRFLAGLRDETLARKRGPYKPELHRRISDLLMEGKTFREIMRATGCGKNTVLIVSRLVTRPPCGCGRPAGHYGQCRTRIQKFKNV